jgi:hypothetical protein
MGKYFILDDGRILVDEDIFDCEGGDFSEQDSAKGVCDRGIKASEGKCGVVGGMVVELNIEVLGLMSVGQVGVNEGARIPL